MHVYSRSHSTCSIWRLLTQPPWVAGPGSAGAEFFNIREPGHGYSVKQVIEAARRATGAPIPARAFLGVPAIPPALVLPMPGNAPAPRLAAAAFRPRENVDHADGLELGKEQKVLTMRILITGGAGFIGSHLSPGASGGRSLKIFMAPPRSPAPRRTSTLCSATRASSSFVTDATQPILLDTDRIYTLACPASPVHYQVNPVKTVKTNVMGTINTVSGSPSG